MPQVNNSINYYTGTCATITATTGILSNSTTVANVNFWASGTSTTNYISYNSSPYSVSKSFSYPKDGEIRIDPETGESSIFLSEYDEWINCDVELKTIKGKDGNKQSIISATFEFSVSRLKKKQSERMVLTEKYIKADFWDFVMDFPIGITGGVYNTVLGNSQLLNINANSYNYTTGIDPNYYYLKAGSTTTGIDNLNNLA